MHRESQVVIEIAVADVGESEEELTNILPGDQVKIRRRSDYRDFSILEIVCTSAASGVVTLVIDVLKDYIKARLAPDRDAEKRAISIKVGDVLIEIKADSKPAEVEHEFGRLTEGLSDE